MSLAEKYRETYNKLSSKYSLPPVEEMDSTYEISDIIERERFIPMLLLRFIRRRMVSLFDSWVNYLHTIVMPGQHNMILYEESSCFSEGDKKKIISLMTKIMSYTRQSLLLELSHDDKKEAEFITFLHSKWVQVNPKLQEIARKSCDVWIGKDSGAQNN